ncbi:MAG: hypothetical protein KAT18_06425 [Candidatus Latescibacteria bacterium]|nr:hypothetical protein [Candidatus Latescibacterota bacterium]
MKKYLLFILLVLIVGPPVAWKLQKDRTGNITVMDASVTDEKRTHHAGLIWMTEHLKIRTTDLDAHDLNDYFGYFPASAERVRRLEAGALDDTDLLFITDARGVWRSGLERFGVMLDRDRDELLHSGFSRYEIDEVVDYINSGRTAVGEALLFYAEHEGGKRSSRRLAEAFGVEWTGWIGGWFKDLNNIRELPFWVRAMYERRSGQQWSYRGSGVIFLKPESGEFIVLTAGIELREPRPEIVISRRTDVLAEGVDTGVPLWGWFEVVEAGISGEVQAMIRLRLTGAGERVLEEKGLTPSFPAVVAQRIERKTYYLAADLSKVPTWLGPAKVKWMTGIRSQLSTLLEKAVAGERAFWCFYIPFVRNILNEAAYFPEGSSR